MKRREFLTLGLAGGAAAVLPLAGTGCAMAPVRPDGSPEPVPVDAYLRQGARTMSIVAHPDDELFWGAVLARSSIHYGTPLHMLVFTHGDGGECCVKEGCGPDLGAFRGEEMKRAAEIYHAELRHERFWNAPLPMESFPKRHEIFAKWRAQGDPVAIAVESVRAFRPDVVFTFGPDYGMTGHPEHQLASRFAGAGIRLAADPSVTAGGLPPHRVARVYYCLNAYWPFRLLKAADPVAESEVFDATLPCVGARRCIDVMAELSRAHRSQANDMGNVRVIARWLEQIHLRRVDPFSEPKDPYEPVKNPRSEAAP